MRTAWNPTLEQERTRFALRHTCEDCGHFDPAAQRCRHEWPTAGHRRADYEAEYGDLEAALDEYGRKGLRSVLPRFIK